jgi:K+-sensing histidine kinase KdpD
MVEMTRVAPFAGQGRSLARIAAVVVPLATCAVLSTVRDGVPAATAVLVLVLWVVAGAATGDRVAGLLAAISGAAWFDFFLTSPYQRFTIASSDDVQATVLLVAINLAVTEIALWGHRQRAGAARRSGYLDGVLNAARLVSDGDTPAPALVKVVAGQIADVLGADACSYLEKPIFDSRIAVLDHDGFLSRRGHTVDVDRVGIPTDEYVAIPVRRGTRVVGHFLVTAASHAAYPSGEQLRVAVLLADQVAVAVDGS